MVWPFSRTLQSRVNELDPYFSRLISLKNILWREKLAGKYVVWYHLCKCQSNPKTTYCLVQYLCIKRIKIWMKWIITTCDSYPGQKRSCAFEVPSGFTLSAPSIPGPRVVPTWSLFRLIVPCPLTTLWELGPQGTLPNGPEPASWAHKERVWWWPWEEREGTADSI